MRPTYRKIAVVFTLAIAVNASAQDPAQDPGREIKAEQLLGKLVTPSPLITRLPKLLQELVKAQKSDEQVIEGLYLAALIRMATEQETKQAKRQVADGKDRMAALEKVLKSLTESPEFSRLHPDLNLRKALERLPQEKKDPNVPGKGPFFGR